MDKSMYNDLGVGEPDEAIQTAAYKDRSKMR